MSDKNKYSDQFEDMLRYLNNSMTDSERYTFEQELERDPFLYEAFEGLSGHKSSEIERDIRSIDVIAGKRRIISLGFLKYVGYAAGVAVMILGGYWAIQNIDFSKKQTVQNDETNDLEVLEPYKPVQTDTIDSLAVVDSAKILIADAGLKPEEKNLAIQEPLPKAEKEIAKKELTKKKATTIAAEPQTVEVADEEFVVAETEIDDISAPLTTTAPAKNTTTNDTGREDMEAPENALKRPGVNADPQPLGGTTLFKKYLDDNAKYPETSKSTRKEYVKVRFLISKTGEPYGFVIEKSPGEAFSHEAIRVIKNGPKWSPEIKDGIPVEGEVTLKINFKP